MGQILGSLLYDTDVLCPQQTSCVVVIVPIYE